MLYIFGQDEKLLTILSNDNPKSCPYFSAPHTEKLNGENTFDFSVPFSHEDSVYVLEENLVAFKDLDGNYQLFIIRQVEETHDEQKLKVAYCESAAVELIDEIVKDLRPENVSAGFALSQVLTGTRWQGGTVADLGLNSTNFYYINVLSSVFKIAAVWGGEVVFRVTVSGNAITGRYVDIVAQRGNTTGKRFEYSKDITVIKRKVDSANLKTALYGRGKGEQTEDGFGRRVTFADVVWSTGNNDPVDKPAGQEWVGDPTALSQFGRFNPDSSRRHRFGLYEDGEETDPAKLLQKAWDALQEQKQPLVQYELSVIDLEKLTGYDHEKVRLGDVVGIVDTEFVPALVVNAKVIEITRYLDEPEKAEVKLGNFFANLTSEVSKIYDLDSLLNWRRGIWDTVGDSNGPVATSRLEGIIDALQNQVRAGTGSVTITDSEGILIVDDETTPTKALRLLGGIFAIANSKDPVTGDWNWRTFGTGDGFTADLINVGTLAADRVTVGAGTTYEAGYNPTEKETPAGATAKANAAEGNVKEAVQNGNVPLPATALNGFIDVLQNIIQQSSNFYWDNSGFYAVDPVNTQKLVRITSGGLGISSNGGGTFATAITGDGINASAIKVGTLSADRVTVGAATAFEAGYNPSTKEDSITKGSSAPSNPNTDKLWLDTSVTPNVLKRWHPTNGWVKATPTTASEVGADTPEGSQSKANAAETNAKNAVANGQVSIPTNALNGAIDVALTRIQRDSYFYWDTSGFYAVDPANSNRKVRITSGGIAITTNGGSSWTTAITGNGIVADTITSGAINANLITTGQINANLITTGTLNASLINVTNLSASSITSGTLSANRISGGTISGVNINVTTDLYVGAKIYMNSSSFTADLVFTSSCKIYADPVGNSLNYSAACHNFYTKVNFTDISATNILGVASYTGNNSNSRKDLIFQIYNGGLEYSYDGGSTYRTLAVGNPTAIFG